MDRKILPVSWFRSSLASRYQAQSELRNQNDTGNQIVASVLRFRNSPGVRYGNRANFGIWTLAALALFVPAAPVLAAPPELANVIKADKPYGEGHMNFLFIKAYSAKLWTDASNWSMDAPFAMEITYGMGFDTEDLTERTIKEMKNVDPSIDESDVAKLTPELNKVYPPVKAGDRLVALYVPGKPVMFSHNGVPTGSIGGETFARDFFGIWLSPNTSAPSLRKELLRQK